MALGSVSQWVRTRPRDKGLLEKCEWTKWVAKLGSTLVSDSSRNMGIWGNLDRLILWCSRKD
ncbi:unnamed protein product [Prunus armeniaca]|uniref:Uncharacterized protein n=1 Tax=Prunus armeniaca TaxID=36596 RepID=A0A6J5VQ46_PRUAR|nr:unnamed protein product [Prunus armeniaca]CAB4320408.1 unnamed protein product [Prunus armeniaca]